jgi:hypothetical protein
MRILKYISIIILAIYISGCTKKIPLQSNYEPQIFISGAITNYSHFLAVTILKSTDVSDVSGKTNAVKDVKIKLYTKNKYGVDSIIADSFNFVPSNPWQSTENDIYISYYPIFPVIGNTYWLEVTTPDNKVYESEYEVLKEPIVIKSISNGNGKTRVTFEDPKYENNFYYANFDFYKNGATVYYDFKISSDALFNGNKEAFIEISIDDGMMPEGFDSIEVVLYHINYSSFVYQSNLFDQSDANYTVENGDPGPLFAPPPVYLTGNIHSVETQKKVLGNFGIYSIDEKSFVP